MEGHLRSAYKLFIKFDALLLGIEKKISSKILKNAKGIILITEIKIGLVFSSSIGSGIILVRKGGKWSGPCMVSTLGLGYGYQLGGSISENLIILNTDSAVNSFISNTQITLGIDVSVAAGPLGRKASGDIFAGEKGFSACFSYSISKGLFVGVCLDGALVFIRNDENEDFYGKKVTPAEIFLGEVEVPANKDLDNIWEMLNYGGESKKYLNYYSAQF